MRRKYKWVVTRNNGRIWVEMQEDGWALNSAVVQQWHFLFWSEPMQSAVRRAKYAVIKEYRRRRRDARQIRQLSRYV